MSLHKPVLADPRRCRCGGNTKIVETRLLCAEEGPLVRRRACELCGQTAVTYEITQSDYWDKVRLRNNVALRIAAEYILQEADRLSGVNTVMQPVRGDP